MLVCCVFAVRVARARVLLGVVGRCARVLGALCACVRVCSCWFVLVCCFALRPVWCSVCRSTSAVHVGGASLFCLHRSPGRSLSFVLDNALPLARAVWLLPTFVFAFHDSMLPWLLSTFVLAFHESMLPWVSRAV